MVLEGVGPSRPARLPAPSPGPGPARRARPHFREAQAALGGYGRAQHWGSPSQGRWGKPGVPTGHGPAHALANANGPGLANSPRHANGPAPTRGVERGAETSA